MRLLILGIVGAVLLSGCASPSAARKRRSRSRTFTQWNLHAVETPSKAGTIECRASYLNWVEPTTGHKLIPVNTPVEVIEDPSSGDTFTLRIVGSGDEIKFGYDPSGMAGMPRTGYIAMLVASDPVSLDALSELDRKGIRQGKALPGMSKEGVKFALGYPARKRTPSLDAETWVYWKTRWNTLIVRFDKDGKVTLVR